MRRLAGFDIGGTKCAVVLGRAEGSTVTIVGKRRFLTPGPFERTLSDLEAALAALLEQDGGQLEAIGVSCGGPLNSRTGRVLSPPNLPGWDDVDVVSPLATRWGVPVALENDANAGALAEWRWGSGRGLDNVVFLTFGTGMGAGLILNGKLYRGAVDLAGEVGHLRLAPTGPVGFGKAGSFEGFCSGSGIAQLARLRLREWIANGKSSTLGLNAEGSISAEQVGAAADGGDALAEAIWQEVGHWLGHGIAVLVDLLNPELVVLGSIYARQQQRLERPMRETLSLEAIPQALAVCRVEPAALGEAIGDFSSLAIAQAVAVE